MSARIRPADAGDGPAIRAVHLAAFPTGLEADLVDRLEADGDSRVSLVAEQAGQVVGHVLMSRMRVEGGVRPYRALGLAPVAVIPADQRRGIGAALIRAALARAREDGEELVFVLGEPAYYRRFGFSAQVAARFESPYAGPYLMAQRLAETPLPEAGQADYAPAFAALG